MKRRGVKEFSFRTPDPAAAVYEQFQNDMLDPEPMSEKERLRLYDVALEIQKLQSKAPDPKPARARAERNELDNLVSEFIGDLVRYTASDVYTWADKNLTAKFSLIQIKRQTSPHPETIWRVEFF